MNHTSHHHLIQKYNRPSTVVIVASFPGKTNRSIAAIDAVASYTDHFARSFRKEMGKHNGNVIVLAQKTGPSEEWYEERGMLIGRVWKKGSPLAYVQILCALQTLHAIRNVIVQFEFHQFGGNSTTATFPLFLAGLRIIGKKTVLVMHQAVEDIGELSGHVNIFPDTIKYRVFSMALRVFYKAVGLIADTIITHTEILRDRLMRLTGKKTITVIPHGMGAIANAWTKKTAREKLAIPYNARVILAFGFLAWYKGSDWITKTVSGKKAGGVTLILAGGKSPNLAGASHYQTFVNKVKKCANRSPKIFQTGFVDDRDISLYFAAADLVVLPYRTLMSSSGPMAMAINFKKPFILSHALIPYTKDPDFADAMERLGITANDISFPLRADTFGKKLQHAFKPDMIKKLTSVSTQLYETRNWNAVAALFYSHIVADCEPVKKSAILDLHFKPAYAA